LSSLLYWTLADFPDFSRASPAISALAARTANFGRVL
jgi:hypothetical protein